MIFGRIVEQFALMLVFDDDQPERLPLFNAALDVVKGAFHFTTSALAKLNARDVTVSVAGATAGIWGTDVRGKTGARMSISALEKAMGKSLDAVDKEAKMDFDTVCLIDGKISITHGGEAPFVMDQPQTFYIMPKNAAPLPVGGLSAEQLAKWMAETEIAAGQGATRNGGKWKVYLLTASNERDALAAYDELRGAGYDARIRLGNTNCSSRNCPPAPKQKRWRAN